MRSAVVAAALVGLSAAAWAPSPEEYPGHEGGSWGETTTSSAPAAPESSAPAYSAPSEAPVPSESAPAPYTDTWVTEVKTAWETYCPKATEVTHGGVTYTATTAETLTITNCPGGCTISYPATQPPVPTTTYAPAPPPPAENTPVPPPTTYAPVPPPVSAPPAPYPVGNSTVPPAPSAPGTTAPAYPSSPVPATGAASQLSAAGAAIMAIFGLVAAL